MLPPSGQNGQPSRTTTILTPSGTREADISTPMRAIRAKCLDCSGGHTQEVAHCPIADCPLYPYRLGKSPFRAKRQLSADQKAAVAERFAKARRDVAADVAEKLAEPG
jgi:hypothetical protein